MQLTGPMNIEITKALQKMGSIQFQLGDFLQAIELQTKVIILQEKMLGFDSPMNAYAYTTLALYHHTVGSWTRAFKYMRRAL